MSHATLTPMIRLGELFAQREVYAKCEFLAPSGCFKIRGATHLLQCFGQTDDKPLLVVPSMGNTALGAATAAHQQGCPMVGVVPETISKAKDEKLQALGVELMKVAGGGNELLQRATEVAEQRHGYFVHPHLDPQWTDGYKTIAEEILHVLPGCRSLVFPVGGGGLLMGITQYLKQHPAPVQLAGCEPYNYPKYRQFQHQRTHTVADGLILEVPHRAVQQRIDELAIEIALVHEADILGAMRQLYEKHALVVEPSSAITLAFIKTAKHLPEPICAVLTGHNIAEDDFKRMISVDNGT